MQEFDFENIEVTDENLGENEFDFSKVFEKGEMPDANDPDLLNKPVNDYGEDDEDEGNPDGGVLRIPKPKNPSGSHGKKVEEKELALV